ncbi:MAG TPA: thioesterase family protein [Steroidobacteraceae bacterium]
MGTEFSTVLASIADVGDGSSCVTVPPDWQQGRTVFGGLQMALAGRAMRRAMPAECRDLPLRSAQMTFINPLPGGERLRLRAQLLRRSRSTVHARCDIETADGSIACSVVGIFGVARASQFVREMPAPQPGKRPEELAHATYASEFAPAFLQHFEGRWALGDVPFSGYPEPRSLIYARLRDRDCGPEDALLALADMVPTPVLSMLTRPAPANSLNWMVEILRDPAALDLHDWVLIDTEVRAGTAGYLSQTSVLYGPDGHAYSVSHQTVGVFG